MTSSVYWLGIIYIHIYMKRNSTCHSQQPASLTVKPKNGKNTPSRILSCVYYHPQGRTRRFYQCCQVVTLVKRKSWKVMMDTGQDPKEGLFVYL